MLAWRRPNFPTVDDYIDAPPWASREVLERVRGVIRKALPDADETISYQIPAYKLNGNVALYFAGWKEHYSLYPATGRLIAAFKGTLKSGEIVKSTIRFPLTSRVPTALITRIARFRAMEAAERGK